MAQNKHIDKREFEEEKDLVLLQRISFEVFLPVFYTLARLHIMAKAENVRLKRSILANILRLFLKKHFKRCWICERRLGPLQAPN
ncbi:MAG: hypothetical protein B6D38_00880 [Anaerolineae bacterium UTCFX1]|nr:MAG: hypothetical protein B6D38_00880 [Anaerolineae bacterium UTCFX1]